MYHRVEILQAHCLSHAALTQWYRVESGGGYTDWSTVQKQVNYFYIVLSNIKPHKYPLRFHLSKPQDGAH